MNIALGSLKKTAERKSGVTRLGRAVPVLDKGTTIGAAGWAYLSGVIGLGGLLAGLLFWQSPPSFQWPLLTIAGLAAVSQLMALSLFGPTSISLSFPFTFLAILWFGPAAGILVNASAMLVHAWYPKRRPLIKVAVNLSSAALAAGLGGLTYQAGGGHLQPHNVVGNLQPAMIGLVVYFLASSLTISGAISVTTRQPVFRVWVANYRWLSVYYGAVGLTALIVASMFESHEAISFLIFVPALAVPWAFTRIAVARAKELEQKRRHLAQMTVLQQVAVRSNTSGTLEDAMHQVLQGALELAPAESLGLLLPRARQPGLYLASQVSAKGAAKSFPLGELGGAVAETLARGESVLHEGALFLPLRIGDRFVGALGVCRTGSEEEMKPLLTLAEFAATVIDRQLKARDLDQSRWKVLQGQEAVRKGVAQNLHGPVQSRLLVLWHRLGQMEARQQGGGPLQGELEAARAELKEVHEAVRSLSYQLYPGIVNIGLVPALRSLCGRFEGVLDLDLRMGSALQELDLRKGIPEELRLILYRVVEEALTNVIKHAQATKVEVWAEVESGSVAVAVADNGRGFVVEDVTPGVGLRLIQEYVTAAKGAVEFRSRPQSGATVRVSLPLLTPPSSYSKSASEVAWKVSGD